MNHLVLYLENGKSVFLASNIYSDSQFCRDGGALMGKLWDKSKVMTARTFVTKTRGNMKL